MQTFLYIHLYERSSPKILLKSVDYFNSRSVIFLICMPVGSFMFRRFLFEEGNKLIIFVVKKMTSILFFVG